MRAENYSFYKDFKGPEDSIVCGNSTRKNTTFQDIVRQGILNAVAIALGNKGYSDQDFLNSISKNRRFRGSLVVIVVSVLSFVVVFMVGIPIGVYVCKHRTIKKKRRGSNEVKEMEKTLNERNLNFKYSTLEKARGSFDNGKKIGQGGFGTVYEGVLPDGRDIDVKWLLFNNRHRARDFYNEVNIISTVEHKNFAWLLGCSCSGPESLLVYENLQNKSLDRFIFGKIKNKNYFDS